MTRWRHATVRLDCGCIEDVHPTDPIDPGTEMRCGLHGTTTVVRWTRTTC